MNRADDLQWKRWSKPAHGLIRLVGFWRVSIREEQIFPDLETVFQLQGKRVTRDSLSDVIFVSSPSGGFYVKRYRKAGGHHQEWFGKPRIQREWENLQHFANLGLSTLEWVGYGMERRGGAFVRGALITREIVNSTDLSTMIRRQDLRLRDAKWVRQVCEQVADGLARMHADHFCHGDMRWRNLLVSEGDSPVVYFFDSPAGRRWWGPFLAYRRVRDLACLDKKAKQQFSRTQRLRFYLRYKGIGRLQFKNKREIRKVLHFFENRR